MKKLLYFSILLFSCVSKSEQLQGNWEMVSHDTVDNFEGLQDAILPFKAITFKNDSVYIDGKPQLLVIKEDQLRLQINDQFHWFKISKKHESVFYLHSKTFTPEGKTQSFYYFSRKD